ncbi:MAG: DNA-processing protein DprA [Actinomycetota bacterium]
MSVDGRADVRVARRRDAEFLDCLREIEPVPETLWVLGRDLRALGPCVAIVGARSPTPYGLEVARGLASDLASAGVCVVSGMARGIDAAAHEGALAARGATVAVLGSGVDVPYPAMNRPLYERIARNGTIVSEFAPGTRARKFHFPRRNRIIAALASAVVVVQAARRSGALGTAGLALDAGREVLAVPGDVRSELSVGPHALLRDGAKLCACAGDVLDGLHLELIRPAGQDPKRSCPQEAAVVRALAAGPARADQIAARAELDHPAAMRAIARLEIAGIVARGPGGVYRRREIGGA